ncbi:MAG: PAS domain S-box protein, partial [Oceanihabitans sp.]|nr:PAS domain S-box protein [Oceanihabitans sp.]
MFQIDQEIFNVLFQAVSEGVIVVDEQQNIVFTNASTDSMFGYQKGELLNQTLNVLIPKNYHAGHGAHFNGFMKHKESRPMGRGRDLYGAHKDGSSFPVEAGLNPFQMDGQGYIMALVIDISVRKQQEIEIQQLNE